jgi:hypothetical protein
MGPFITLFTFYQLTFFKKLQKGKKVREREWEEKKKVDRSNKR